MRKTIRLTESELMYLVKRIINEAKPEPVVAETFSYAFEFTEGQTKLPTKVRNTAISEISEKLRLSVNTLSQFMGSGGGPLQKHKGELIPDIARISVKTSSTGSPKTNQRVAQGRIEELKSIVREAFYKVNWFGLKISPEIIEELMQVTTTYNPTAVNANFFDRDNSDPYSSERVGLIQINVIETKGHAYDDIESLTDTMRSGVGEYLFGFGDFDPQKILSGLRRLAQYGTQSDISDMNRELRNEGGLQGFLNRELSKNTKDAPYWKKKAIEAINQASRNSGGQIIAFLDSGGNILLNL